MVPILQMLTYNKNLSFHTNRNVELVKKLTIFMEIKNFNCCDVFVMQRMEVQETTFKYMNYLSSLKQEIIQRNLKSA